MADPGPIDFQVFLNRIEDLKLADVRSVDGRIVADAAAFEKMREFLVGRYAGTDVAHSYADETGQIWDCIPIEQQKSVRNAGEKVAEPVDMPGPEGEGSADAPPEVEQPVGGADQYGNTRACPPGTIPMRRITLHALARFGSLDDFFQKGPNMAGRIETDDARHLGAGAPHKYAHAYQKVDNNGGGSYLNIWKPTVLPTLSQIFSLSQQWFAGGSGSSLQTVECGWQVYPAKYGDALPRLFIYWTPDDYKPRSQGGRGCYNLDCSAFIQVSSTYSIAGSWTPSTYGGTQAEMFYGFYFTGGNWWLYLGGSKGRNALGYYPGSLFGSGQLSKCAQTIDFGGETVSSGPLYPQMGSGHFASEGKDKAAYQRNCRYFQISRPGYYANADLTESQPSPKSYTIDVKSKGDWKEHFYFGGPGGA